MSKIGHKSLARRKIICVRAFSKCSSQRGCTMSSPLCNKCHHLAIFNSIAYTGCLFVCYCTASCLVKHTIEDTHGK